MIIIHDNGFGFDMHSVDFLDTGELGLPDAERLLKLALPKGRVLAVLEGIEWRVSDYPKPIHVITVARTALCGGKIKHLSEEDATWVMGFREIAEGIDLVKRNREEREEFLKEYLKQREERRREVERELREHGERGRSK